MATEKSIGYQIGVGIGRFIRNCIFAVGLFAIVACILAANAEAEPSAPVKVEAPVKAKAKPHKKAKHHAKKKCVCDCKKVVDKPVEPVYIVIIENANVEGQENGQEQL